MTSGRGVAVVCLLALLLAGCRSERRVKVRFWHAMGGESAKTLKTMCARFDSLNPDVHVELVGMGTYDALAQKLMGAVAVKEPPTIAQMYENWTTQLHAAGELVFLDSFVHGPAGLSPEDLADIYPALLENNTWDGRLLTLPFNKSVPTWYWNVPMFRAAGYEQFPGDWPTFREALRALTKRDEDGEVEVWGAAGGTDIWIFGSMLYQKGGRFLDREDGEPEFNRPVGVAALQFQVDLIRKDRVQNTDVSRTPMDEFLIGRMACLTGSSTWRAPVLDKETFQVGMAPVPRWDRSAAIIYGTNIGMFRRAQPEEQAAAWRFISWFLAAEQQTDWSLGTWYVPVHRRCLDDPRLRERLDVTPGMRDCYGQMDHAVFEPRGLRWLAGRKALVEELEAAMLGDKTPRQALDAAARRYRAVR